LIGAFAAARAIVYADSDQRIRGRRLNETMGNVRNARFLDVSMLIYRTGESGRMISGGSGRRSPEIGAGMAAHNSLVFLNFDIAFY